MDTLARVKATEGSVWLPDAGVVDKNHRDLVKRLAEYDERLTLGRHERYGDWCVFLKPRANPFGEDKPFPVLGIGTTLLPADEVMAKLRKYDALRQGDKLLDEINKRNDDALAMVRRAADEATGELATAAESFLREQGKAPYTQSLRPTKQTAIPGH